MTPAYRPEIDGLRAVAVISVLLFHIDLEGWAGGFVGVDVFFVISGYLMTKILLQDMQDGRFSFARFYIRRTWRLFPALFTTLLLTFIASAFILSPEHLSALGETLIGAMLSFSNILFWLDAGYFDAAAETKPLLHTWSLGVEVQFYAVFPVLLLALVGVTRGVWQPVAIGAVCCVSIAAAELMIDHDAAGAFFLLPFRLAEFGLGALLVWAEKSGRRNAWLDDALLLIGLVLIGLAVFTFSGDTRFPGLASLVPCVGAALVLCAGNARHAGRLLSNPLMIGIGTISYSLYLVHWPVIVLYKYVTLRELTAGDQVICLAVSTLLAIAVYGLVEARYRRAEWVRHAHPLRYAAVLSAVGLVAMAPAAHAALARGWDWRLADDRLDFASARSFHKAYYGGRDCNTILCTTRPGAPTAYFVGDSHARHYFHGLSRSYPNASFHFYRWGSCDFWSLSVQALQGGTVSSKCTNAKREAFAAIRQTPRSMLISESWLRIAQSRLIDTGDGRRFSFRDAPMAEAARFVVDELLKVQEHTGVPQIVVIGAVPQFGPVAPYACLSRLSWLPQPPDCSRANRGSREIERIARWNKELAGEIARRGRDRIAWIDPFDALCDETHCKSIEKSLPNYSDRSHLSVWGSQRVVRRLKQRIDTALDAGTDAEG